MDLKLALVNTFMPKLHFYHVDSLVDSFSYIVGKATTLNGILISNTNPFLITATILTTLADIKESFPALKLRIEHFEDDLL